MDKILDFKFRLMNFQRLSARYSFNLNYIISFMQDFISCGLAWFKFTAKLKYSTKKVDWLDQFLAILLLKATSYFKVLSVGIFPWDLFFCYMQY